MAPHSNVVRGGRSLLLFLAIVASTGCAADMKRTNAAASVHSIGSEYLDSLFAAFPELPTALGVAGLPHDALTDLSAARRRRFEQTEDDALARLEGIDAALLPEGSAAAVTHGFLTRLLRNNRDYRICRMELWNVSPTYTGWQSAMASLADTQPVGTAAQNEAAYSRFSQLPRYLEQEIANLRDGLARGYSAPRHNVVSVIAQMDALLAAAVDESPFVAMAPAAAGEFRERMRRLEQDAIRPAMTQYRDFLRDEYLASARVSIGVSALPDGDACYTAAVRYHSTMGLTAGQVHQTGLEEMARIHDEMREIADRSFDATAIPALLELLRSDRRYLMSSREDVQRLAEEAVARARDAMPRAFGVLPKAEVRVLPVPGFQEANAPFGYYFPPAEDGSRPALYYINLHEAEKQPRAGLETTAFHEAYPGHHLQVAIAMERSDLHPVQRYLFLSGFGEGWALYSERLSDELGLFSSDVDRLGMLSDQALRAARLVVDAGMHALGWSRDEAIAYMLENTAMSRSAATAEIDRYIAVPGQATAYMIGALEIRRLRALAEAELGEAFDLRAFHDRVLEDGAVPLDMLTDKIERWIAGR
jgi:uncharacterized protein (DUF885 family)